MRNFSQYYIGLFDSGVGGLSVFHALEKAFPQEPMLYLADTMRFPYGEKSPSQILQLSMENTSALIDAGAKIIVIACHTASCCSDQLLKHFFPIPIIGIIQPSIEKALQVTRNQKVAIFGTQATINANVYSRLFEKISPSITVFPVACPKLAPMVEQNLINTSETRAIIRDYLKKIEDADTLILGSTHYSYLSDIILEECGKDLFLIDGAKCIAAKVDEYLKGNIVKQKHKFLISGKKEQFLAFLHSHPPKGNFEVQSYTKELEASPRH